MAMNADDRFRYVRYFPDNTGNQLAELFGNSVSHGIRNIHRGSAGFNNRFDDL